MHYKYTYVIRHNIYRVLFMVLVFSYNKRKFTNVSNFWCFNNFCLIWQIFGKNDVKAKKNIAPINIMQVYSILKKNFNKLYPNMKSITFI